MTVEVGVSDLDGSPEDRFSPVADLRRIQFETHLVTYRGEIHSIRKQVRRLVRKQTICIGENKDADQLCFATRIVQFLFYLNPKFQASSLHLCFYSPVCVGPVRKPHCWFSHEAAQVKET